jgi:hypothetical protein
MKKEALTASKQRSSVPREYNKLHVLLVSQSRFQVAVVTVKMLMVSLFVFLHCSFFVIRPAHLVIEGQVSIERRATEQDAIDQGTTEMMVLTTRSGRETLKSLGDLQSHVKISSPSAALEFVRLDSTPSVYSLFGGQPYLSEILSIDEAKLLAIGFNELTADSYRSRLSPGVSGVTTLAFKQAHGIALPQVSRTDEGFLVRRAMVQGDSRPRGRLRIVQVKEWVSKSGALKRAIERVICSAPNDWSFERFDTLRASYGYSVPDRTGTQNGAEFQG